MLHELRTNARTESPITHNEAGGGLSTVIDPAASDTPNSSARRL